jgi:hypothetical protein
MSRPTLLANLLLLPILLSSSHSRAAESSLEIVNAAISPAEDAPAASSEYQFLPGDTVYFSFEVAHFGIKRNEELNSSQIDLSYEVAFEDGNGIPVAESVSSRIAEQLSAEDKNWLPKRRASFEIPTLVAAGQYRIRVTVKDAFANAERSAIVSLHIGGENIATSDGVSVQEFRFLRNENDTTPLTVPAFRPGDSVYTRFDVAGFVLGKENEYHVTYGLVVLGPDGKTFVEAANAGSVQDKTFYPAKFVPVTLAILTKPTSARGAYLLILKARDVLGNRACEFKKSFTLE